MFEKRVQANDEFPGPVTSGRHHGGPPFPLQDGQEHGLQGGGGRARSATSVQQRTSNIEIADSSQRLNRAGQRPTGSPHVPFVRAF